MLSDDEKAKLANRLGRIGGQVVAGYRGRFGEVADGFTEMLMLELQMARSEAALAGAIAQLKRAVVCEVGSVESVPRLLRRPATRIVIAPQAGKIRGCIDSQLAID